MRKVLFTLCIAIAATLAACRSQQPVVEKQTEVRYETRIEERLVTDTVYLEIPAQSALEITPADSSHLETDYAISDAWNDELGLLHHSLKNKAQRKPVEVTTKETETQTTANETQVLTKTETEYVEKELSAWQMFRIKAFWWLVFELIAILAWTFRTPLCTLISKVFNRHK